MKVSDRVEELKLALSGNAAAFADLPDDPVRVAAESLVAASALGEIARRYRRHGYVILDIEGAVTEANHLRLAGELRLGEPFVPPLYYAGGKTPAPISTISATVNAQTQDADHPSFGASVGQALHCDGTLQPAGFVKATLMSCRSPAAEGGDNGLFDAVTAFARLFELDSEAAVSLTGPAVLLRKANINGCTDENIGPAFAIDHGRVIGRYCETETDSWCFPDESSDHPMRRGVEFLRAIAQEGSSLYRVERLRANQAIVFDNTRLSHSRTAYRDDARTKRCLYRTLHLEHPSA